MTVELNITDNEILESVMTSDRIVEVKFGVCNLADTQFTITNDMIKRIIDADN